MFELTILTKSGRELKRYELTGEKPIKIGRALDCDIKIGVPEVSRRHARVEQVDEDEWRFTDLESTHGSYVEGKRVNDVVVTSGLEVVIGPAVLRFENLAARIGAELAESLRGDSVDEDQPNFGSSMDEAALDETIPPSDSSSQHVELEPGRRPRFGLRKRS